MRNLSPISLLASAAEAEAVTQMSSPKASVVTTWIILRKGLILFLAMLRVWSDGTEPCPEELSLICHKLQ